jgi:hypothetical protein
MSESPFFNGLHDKRRDNNKESEGERERERERESSYSVELRALAKGFRNAKSARICARHYKGIINNGGKVASAIKSADVARSGESDN